MKVLQINTVYPNGSTGKIARGIKEICDSEQIECRVAYRYREGNEEIKDTYAISSYLDCHVHNRLARYTMLQGCFSKIKTSLFLKKVSKYAPDIIHLHNIHGSFINHKKLFNYIKKHNVKVIWTLHDCWSMTGACPHFDMIGCDKWKFECSKCPQKKPSLIDTSRRMHKNKKKWFCGIENMVLVTPSEWLADLTQESYMREYPVKVINNGIDLSIFKPTESDFREKYDLNDKKIVLGVAFGWGARKGLDVFCALAKSLPENYKIVLVGTNDEVDKTLPENILSIHRTYNQQELAQIYSAADLFVNPTREEALGLVNVEALACGTPVVTFKTGGSPECIDESCGCVVEKNDIDAILKKIIDVCENKTFSQESCIQRASMFKKEDKFKEYIELYRNMMEEK